MEQKRLYRSVTNRKICGVCGGLGRKSKTYQANVKARRTRCKQQNSTLYFAKPVLFWSTGGSYNGSIISKKTR